MSEDVHSMDTPTLRADSGELPNADLFTPTDWESRLRTAVEQTLAKRAARRNERAEFQRRRDHGLAQRHAAKLRRHQAHTEPDTTP